jgi:hypothetical protein
MTTDPIIEELHRIREEIAAQFNYDVFAIGAMLQAKQKEEDRPVVSFSAQPNESDALLTDKMGQKAA